MISEELRKLYPFTFWVVRLSIYNGQVNCQIRELIAQKKGRDYRSPDRENIREVGLMLVNRHPGGTDMEMSMICDDESRLDECVRTLQQSLRDDTQRQLEQAKVMDAIAHLDSVVVTRRAFVD